MRALATIAVLALGCTACAGLAGDGRVEAELLHRSAFCGRDDPRPALTLITDQAAFAATWQRISGTALPRPAMPQVNFGRRLVAVVELGSRRHGGSSLEATGSDAVVRRGTVALPVAAREPEPGMLTTTVLSAPCMAFALDRDGVDVVSALGIPAAVPPAHDR